MSEQMSFDEALACIGDFVVTYPDLEVGWEMIETLIAFSDALQSTESIKTKLEALVLQIEAEGIIATN